MKKNTIKLNESQLRKIVAESVKKVLNEDLRQVLDYPYSRMGSPDHMIQLAYESCHEFFKAYRTFIDKYVTLYDFNSKNDTPSYDNIYAIVKDLYKDFTKIARKIEQYNADAEEAGELGGNGEITSNYFGLQNHD